MELKTKATILIAIAIIVCLACAYFIYTQQGDQAKTLKEVYDQVKDGNHEGVCSKLGMPETCKCEAKDEGLVCNPSGILRPTIPQ